MIGNPRTLLLCLCVVLCACASPVEVPDAGPAQDAGATTDSAARMDAAAPDAGTCTSATACDDGLFCNGAELCMAGRCAPAPQPACVAPRTCSETGDRCIDTCIDADEDGACVPDDCDDGNPRVYPGAMERCDTMDVDEDCDPSTYGSVDGDLDGFNASRCCNVSTSGARTCGDDCDDTRRIVNPGAREVCDADSRDDDCDPSTTDAMLQVTCFPDTDRDRYAPMGATGTLRCACLDAETSLAPAMGTTDCDDTSAGVNPMATETCATGDQNCDGNADPVGGCNCTAGELIDCGFSPLCVARGIATMTYTCSIGGTRDCPADSVFPLMGNEPLCNDVDDDCDGNVDEGFIKVSCVTDSDGDGYAPPTAQPRLVCSDPARTAVGSCPVGTTNRVPVLGVSSTFDCNDGNSGFSPGATDLCATVDDEDCDGVGQEGQVACLVDLDSDKWAAVGAATVMVCPDPSAARADVGGCPAGTTNRMPVAGMYSTYDCNDTNMSVYPGAAENCTTDLDEDCSCGGMTSPITCGRPSGVTCFYDADRDGYAALGAISRMEACGACPDLFTSRRPNRDLPQTFDCDDTNGSTHDVVTCYPDTDGDDRRDDLSLSFFCFPPGRERERFEDCPVGYTGDDRDDCLPSDENRQDLVTCYVDADEDQTTPLPLVPMSVCNDTARAQNGSCPAGYTGYTNSDCNDADRTLQTPITCYPDADGDGYRADTTSSSVCAASCPTGRTRNASAIDCCDRDSATRPGATAYATTQNPCGSFDHDCNGTATLEAPTRTTFGCNSMCQITGSPGWTGAVPACGVVAPFENGHRCVGAGVLMCTQIPMTAARQQACR